MAGEKERKPFFNTPSGISLKRVYTPDDLTGFDFERDLGQPGSFPFTRGIYSTMYRQRLWTMRQYAGYGTATETNRRFRYLLSQGQTGLSVAFDLPTQLGLDSDDVRAKGEVGRCGVAVDSLLDMEELFQSIPLDKISVSMTINATAAAILAMFLVLAEKKRILWSQLSGTVQNDILKEYIARGTYIYPPRPSLRLATDIIAFCQAHVPRWNPISVSGYHIREAGATAVQELAFTLANGLTYIKAAKERGLAVDSFAGRFSFFLASHNYFFEEIAKFRAARRIWAKIMRDQLGARHPQSWLFRFHTQTSGCTLAAHQPENNVVRVALQALAAVLGGTQSLHTNSRDEALSLPTEESARISLRTQQIIALESGVADTVDPLGGSYFIEWLTNELEAKVWSLLAEIEARGGMLAAIENGWVQRQIEESSYAYQKMVDGREHVVVGVNEFRLETERPRFNLLHVSPEVERKQRQKLKALRQRRREKRVLKSLEELRKAATSGENIMWAMMDAVKALATLGEITRTLEEVFGTYEEKILFR